LVEAWALLDIEFDKNADLTSSKTVEYGCDNIGFPKSARAPPFNSNNFYFSSRTRVRL
jgi:hypothetical protein